MWLSHYIHPHLKSVQRCSVTGANKLPSLVHISMGHVFCYLPPGTSCLLGAAFHVHAVHNSQAVCSHHLASQHTGNSHPRKCANYLRLRFGVLHHVLREKRPPLEGTLSKILEEWILRTVREHHLASADLSCSLSSEGWVSFLKQRVFGKLASGYWCVYGHIHQLPEAWGGNWFWMHSLCEYRHPASTFISENVLPVCAPFRTVGFMMNRTTWASLLAFLGLVNPRGPRAEFSWQVRTLHSSPSKSFARHLRSFRIAIGWASQSLFSPVVLIVISLKGILVYWP